MRTTTKAALAGGALGLGFVILRAYQKKTPAAETIKKAATVTTATAAAGALVGAAIETAPHVKKASDVMRGKSSVLRWAEVAAAAGPVIQSVSEFFDKHGNEKEPTAPKASTKKKKPSQKYVFLNGSLGKVRLATTYINKAKGRKSVYSMFGPLRSRASRFGRR